jgi:hypothetical protein
MANMLLPSEERNLTPDEIDALDKRRHRGLLCLVISGQFAIIATVLLLWTGQDMTYAPGWAHPTDYYFIIAIIICLVCGFTGLALRRGHPEF